MTDFIRINQPRVAKIEAMLATIRKSAKSQKIGPEDVAALLAPVAESLGTDAAPASTPNPEGDAKLKPRPVWREPPHQQQIAAFVDAIPREHLTSYITHIVNRLCETYEISA